MVLIAESDPAGLEPIEACKEMARVLLENEDKVERIITMYKMFRTLFTCSAEMLYSLQRGMQTMLEMSAVGSGDGDHAKYARAEYAARLEQLEDVDIEDESFGVEARIEKFLLEEGVEVILNWRYAAGLGIRFGDGERGNWVRKYELAVAFLERALESLECEACEECINLREELEEQLEEQLEEELEEEREIRGLLREAVEQRC
jgi:replicative superfamily II helicase